MLLVEVLRAVPILRTCGSCAFLSAVDHNRGTGSFANGDMVSAGILKQVWSDSLMWGVVCLTNHRWCANGFCCGHSRHGDTG